MRRLRVALVYNAYADSQAVSEDDQSSSEYLREMIFGIARAIRRLGHKVTVVPLTDDLNYLQRRLRRLKPHLVFNQYDDVVHGALYEMRVAAFIRMMGFPMTGSPAIALGLSRHKYMAASLLQGAGVPIPAETSLIERVGELDRRDWHFPLIVHASQEHAGIGMDRHSVVTTKAALKDKVREILKTYRQPALVQQFLRGREFNVGVIGGRKLRIMPLAEVDYSTLPEAIPPIMSYAAKWIETTVEFQQTRIVCPAKTKPDLTQAIAETAKKAFRVIGGWGYGRVDIRLDEDGQPRVLEVNCNPCLDNDMGLARAARRAGINYSGLLGIIIKAAFEGPPFDMNLPIFGVHKNPPLRPK
ncbi:MAG: hypothetical protein NTW38_13000 [Candidatus Aminicenantes bacterium]|nr:hypothetical protein [Candidatus Aminicenantes bacterium]